MMKSKCKCTVVMPEPELVCIRKMFLTLMILQTSNLHYYNCVTNTDM